MIHYARFRETGQCFELRECDYSVPNYTLATFRMGKKAGAPVQVRGFWGDCIVGTFNAFGVKLVNLHRPDLFEKGNMQYKKVFVLYISKFMQTELDVAEANLAAMISAYVPRKFKITFVPNEATLTKSKFNKLFSHVVLGLNSPSSISTSIMTNVTTILKDQARLTVEGPEYLSFLKSEEKELYKKALLDRCQSGGWKVVDDSNDYRLESKLSFSR